MKHFCVKCGNRFFKSDLDANGFCRDCTEDLNHKIKVISYEEDKKQSDYINISDYLSDEKDTSYDLCILPLVVAIVSPIILFFTTDKFTELSFLGAILLSILASCYFAFCSLLVCGFGIYIMKKLLSTIAENVESALTVKLLAFLITFLLVLIVSCIIYFNVNS